MGSADLWWALQQEILNSPPEALAGFNIQLIKWEALNGSGIGEMEMAIEGVLSPRAL